MLNNIVENSLGSKLTLDHIAFAVNNIEKSKDFYCGLLGLIEIHREYVKNEDLDVIFLRQDNLSSNAYEIELISPRSADSKVSKFLNKKGEGIHHLAYLAEDIESAISEFKKSGAQILSGYPQKGSRGKVIAFFSPKTTHGVLIEICSIK